MVKEFFHLCRSLVLTWPMAKRLKLWGITYLVGKIKFTYFFFQGPGRLSEGERI